MSTLRVRPLYLINENPGQRSIYVALAIISLRQRSRPSYVRDDSMEPPLGSHKISTERDYRMCW
jgi:hypothetical protein